MGAAVTRGGAGSGAGGRSRGVLGPGRAMRCVLIASTAAELLFYWADAAFLRRLRPPAATAAQVG